MIGFALESSYTDIATAQAVIWKTGDHITEKEMMQKNIITATICQKPYWQGSKSLELMFSFLSDKEAGIRDAYYAELSVKIREIV